MLNNHLTSPLDVSSVKLKTLKRSVKGSKWPFFTRKGAITFYKPQQIRYGSNNTITFTGAKKEDRKLTLMSILLKKRPFLVKPVISKSLTFIRGRRSSITSM